MNIEKTCRWLETCDVPGHPVGIHKDDAKEIARLARLGAAVERMEGLQALSRRGSDKRWEVEDEMKGTWTGACDTAQAALDKIQAENQPDLISKE